VLNYINLTSEEISKKILNANKRVLFHAAGLTDEIASAIILTSERLGKYKVEVALDFAEDLIRIGYGTIESYEELITKNIPVIKIEGLRIGTIIVDDEGWNFTSLPRSIENPENTNFVNAIPIQTLPALPQFNTIESNLNSLENEPKLSSSEIKNVTDKIKRNPPVSPDLKRHVETYQSYVQFAEIEFEGVNISSKKLKISHEIKSILFKNKDDIAHRFQASFKFLDNQQFKELNEIKREIDNLRNSATPSLGKRLGRVLLKSKKSNLDASLQAIKSKISVLKNEKTNELNNLIDESLKELSTSFAPTIHANIPDSWAYRKSGDWSLLEVEDELLCLFKDLAPKAESLLENLQLHCTYKDVTIEMLHDKEFGIKLKKQFPHETWMKPLETKRAVLEKQPQEIAQ